VKKKKDYRQLKIEVTLRDTTLQSENILDFNRKTKLSLSTTTVAAAQQKVTALAGQNRAVTVLAPPKYPSNAKLAHIRPLSGADVAEHRAARRIDYALDTLHVLYNRIYILFF
jgi:hypothetical protein